MKNRFTEAQMLGVLREADGGVAVKRHKWCSRSPQW